MKGLLGQTYFHFVLDSGAAISVVNYGVVGRSYGGRIQMDGVSTAMGTNGLPLNVVGKTKLTVKLGIYGEFTP